jgi:hypothetical protein
MITLAQPLNPYSTRPFCPFQVARIIDNPATVGIGEGDVPGERGETRHLIENIVTPLPPLLKL